MGKIRIAEKSLLDQFCAVLDPLQRHIFFSENSVFYLSDKFPIISSDEKRDRRCLEAPIELLNGSPQLSLSVQVSISAIDCARFRSTTVCRTSKFVWHDENGEQGRLHCCRTATLAYEKLRRICCYALIFLENGTEEIIRFLLIIFMRLSSTFK